MNRRNIMAAAPLLTIAACSAPGQTPNATEAGIQKAIAVTQGALNYVGPALPLIAAFVPAAAPFVPVAMVGIQTAQGLLATLSSTLSAADAQPIIGKIATAVGGVLDAGDQAVALIPAGSQHDQAAAILKAARGEQPILVGLATNLSAVFAPPAAATLAVPRPGVVVPPILTRAGR